RKVRGRNVGKALSRNMEDWKILIPDSVPSYISWDQFLRNVAQLKQNRASWVTQGAVRHGPSLLGGIVYCGRCGSRFCVMYHGVTAGHPPRPYYWCRRATWDPTADRCPSIGADVLEELVGQQILKALEPASLELSLKAADHVQTERGRLHRHWKQQLERARYDAERAQRQYNAVEPENRLVARSLEQHWEEALHRERELKEDYDRFSRETPRQLTADERDRIARLSTDIPALWHAPETDAADRQTLVRQFLQKVVATVQADTEIVDVTLHWVGGFISQHQIKRRLPRSEQLEHFPQLKARMIELRDEGSNYSEIAAALNRAGFRTCYGLEFDLPHVGLLFRRHGLRLPDHGLFLTDESLKCDEYSLQDLAPRLEMPIGTLRTWCHRGWVHWRQLPGYKGRWIIWADADELKRLTKLRNYPHCAGPKSPYPAKLTTPKRKPKTPKK
ncbi:MAG: recombinase zinc beta ribbon domain-containing protein, partial [Tepidisphaeraceae bacterium]